MRFEVTVYKEKKLWLSEAPALGVMSQGKSKKEALDMLADAVSELINKDGFHAEISKSDKRLILSTNNDKETIALMLRQQRLKHGLTLKEIAKRLGSTSVNSFARYEQGKASPSISKLTQLLSAIDPDLEPVISFK